MERQATRNTPTRRSRRTRKRRRSSRSRKKAANGWERSIGRLIAHAPSSVLLDLLGDARTQTHELSKAEEAYRKAEELDPSELSHQRGLGQSLLAEEKYFFFQAEDGIRDWSVTGVQTCALPI